MSRFAKTPIIIPIGVHVRLDKQVILIDGKNGKLTRTIHKSIMVQYSGRKIFFTPRIDCAKNWALAGTERALIHSMLIGVTEGFTKKLQLVGIGYRVSVKDDIVTLTLGFFHSINYRLPDGIIIECPSQTEIILKSADKQIVSQVAANLRSFRCPEPYKGKGIRYSDEIVRIKESKKK
ncbi:50S ribosomal protein L6 [Sodalis sp. CWE]|uniref:50S ribosomal protein L6 n=1 Tax=Sodalis sp. CWE TaxID=2803816 RepID=UPI001C7CB20B|nr:50S ribosomal protein L6 [Sodalis sp. CWE]MBX4180755.1 50S ribosomal protein L6 [Sodalis sp. CWE]